MMVVVRSRNTRDPVPVSSSLPGGLVTIEEMFQMVTATSNVSANTHNIFRCAIVRKYTVYSVNDLNLI